MSVTPQPRAERRAAMAERLGVSTRRARSPRIWRGLGLAGFLLSVSPCSVLYDRRLEAVHPSSPMEETMKKKATKGARKKVRDLATRKPAATRVKAGAANTTVQTKQALQLDSCWL